MAFRSAMALGINLRITDPDLQPESKEARSRLWWSIYMLENILSHMTGRLSGTGSSSFSVDQPVPYTEDFFARRQVMDLLTNETLRKECLKWSLDEQENENCDSFWLKDVETNQGLQFYLLVDLTHIVHVAISELFPPKGFQDTKSYIKRRVRFYDERLDHWLSRLPSAFRFVDESSNLDLNMSSQEQTVLALHYYSARTTLYRPCSPFRRYVGLKEEENAYISQRCLQAALSLIAVFPDVTDLDWVYNMIPWWCMHHFLMQASTMLVIFTQGNNPADSVQMKNVEYSFAIPGVAAQVQAACQKAHRRLHDLSRVDESCRRAFLLYDDILRHVGSSSSTSMYGSAQSNPFSQNQRGGINAQHGRGQSTYNVQHRGEYPRQMALDSSTVRYDHPLSNSGDVPLCVDSRNVDTSMGGIFDPACMEDIFGGTEWIGRALDDQNNCSNSSHMKTANLI
ncbi:hypothetical protein EIK77_004982 [Talaromyces pinophilus]|nr:hypothetical protein EIK77_004982 [Talaromyces pinophilus]